MFEEIRLCIAQFDPVPGDIEGNTARMVEWMGGAEHEGAGLVVFPEESVSGYCIGDQNRNPLLIRESLAAVTERLAPASGRCAAVVGFNGPVEGRRLCDGGMGAANRYAVLQGGRVIASGSKTLMANEGVLDDDRYFIPGDPADIRPVTIETAKGKVRLGVLVCQDMWDDYYGFKPAHLLQERGAQALVVLNASPFYAGRLTTRRRLAAQRCRETGLPLAYVNTVGVQDNGKNVILLDGGSFVTDGSGRVTAQYPMFEEGRFFYTGPQSPVPGEPDRLDELYRGLVFGIRGFFARSGQTGAVIGLSGGIDSALSAVLLVQALGPQYVLGINMPSQFSSRTTRDNARELARRLGIEYLVHPIEDVVQHKIRDMEKVTGASPATITRENIQARERGNILMSHAQERGRFVIGNGNKTEFQRGYATLYGDIIGALMPLGDVAKTDVYRLARHVNGLHGDPIPESIIAIPPSAELSAEQDINKGQGDPFDYDVEGPLGQELVEFERTPAQLRGLFESRKLDPELWAPLRSPVEVYDKMDADAFEQMAWEVFRAIESTVFKRIQAPPIIKISRRSFGFDFRESTFARLKFQS